MGSRPTAPTYAALELHICFFEDVTRAMQQAYILVNAEPGALWQIAFSAHTIKGVKMAHAVTGFCDVIIYAGGRGEWRGQADGRCRLGRQDACDLKRWPNFPQLEGSAQVCSEDHEAAEEPLAEEEGLDEQAEGEDSVGEGLAEGAATERRCRAQGVSLSGTGLWDSRLRGPEDRKHGQESQSRIGNTGYHVG